MDRVLPGGAGARPPRSVRAREVRAWVPAQDVVLCTKLKTTLVRWRGACWRGRSRPHNVTGLQASPRPGWERAHRCPGRVWSDRPELPATRRAQAGWRKGKMRAQSTRPLNSLAPGRCLVMVRPEPREREQLPAGLPHAAHPPAFAHTTFNAALRCLGHPARASSRPARDPYPPCRLLPLVSPGPSGEAPGRPTEAGARGAPRPESGAQTAARLG